MIYKIPVLILFGLVILFGLPKLVIWLYAKPKTFSVKEVLPSPIAVVFGAGLQRDGTPSPVLRDRVATAVDLYKEGKIQKILMSGDNRYITYNEPGAMRAFAIDLGIPADDIILDYAGRRTYDTCYRAKVIFGLKQVILVTQDFHLPRALFTCNMLGLPAVGVPGDRRVYSSGSTIYWDIREIPASLVAMWDVWVRHPLPVLGKPEPVFPVRSDMQ